MGVDADNFVSKLAERDNDDRAHDVVEIMVWLATADQRVTAESGITRYLEEIRRVSMLEPHEEHMAESGITRYLEEIRRVSMLEPHEEHMLAKRWREHGDHAAAHK